MKKPTRTFLFDTKPIVRVIVKNHLPDCIYREPRLAAPHKAKDCRCEQHCRCPKHLYVASIRYREATRMVKWEDAEAYAERWATSRTRESIEQRAANPEINVIGIEDAFDKFIQSKENGNGDSDAVAAKFRTLKRDFLEFLAKRNHGKDPSEQITTLDQVTTSLLEDEWRPTWFNGKGSYWSRTKRREILRSFFKYALENRKWVRTNPALGLQLLRRNKNEIQPTPPFAPWQYEKVLDACALFEASRRDRNRHQLVITNQRLAAFIEVMRWCGPRISDASLMRKDAITKDGNWRYVALKNGRECFVPVPREVLARLEKLPARPDIHPDYYFWSGRSKKQNAADPWQRALTRLWTLVDADAKVIVDKRNKQKVSPSSHMFRNTFAVECRKHGISYAEIALALGDDEQTVKDHYSAYCEEYDEAVVTKLRQTHRKAAKAS